MDGVKQQIRARQAEALEHKHQFEVRKIKREMRDQIDTIRSKNKATITKIRKDYKKEVMDEQTKLEVQLISLRKKNNKLIKDESARFARILEEIQANHKAKIAELQISQDGEIEQRETEHKEYLETARQKFEAEKARLEA